MKTPEQLDSFIPKFDVWMKSMSPVEGAWRELALTFGTGLVLLKLFEFVYYGVMLAGLILLSLQLPLCNGYMLSRFLSDRLLFGHRFTFRSLSIFPSVVAGKLALRLTARDIKFASKSRLRVIQYDAYMCMSEARCRSARLST